MTKPALTALAALALLLPLASCGGNEQLTVPPPTEVVSDLTRSEAAAARVEQDLVGLFAEPLSRGSLDQARRALVADGFRGVGLRRGQSAKAGRLDVAWLAAENGEADTPEEFLQELHGLCSLKGAPQRVEAELLSFTLASTEDRATAFLRLRWAGDSAGAPAGRADLTIHAQIEVALESGDWKLNRFIPARRDDVAHGYGALLTGPADPVFVERTGSVGFGFGISPENQRLVQEFIDQHRTLSLGGLSIVDLNRDERPDIIATRSEEMTLAFINDGMSGFVPEVLPIQALADRPAHVLYVDLDGDGREELVASEASRYEGAQTFAGLWTRTGAPEGQWRHVPRAFAMPNPVGLRRLDVQTVAPFDADGDGDLDLFFAVYGTGESRGPDYNTVEAYDGADNHFFINQGDLVFTEESEARGITGTGYTYVALAFDADHDGDVDIYEGNDFGPNVLWRNDGAAQFTADETMGFDATPAYTMGAALADLDANGAWDLYVSNMSSEEGMRMVPMASGLSMEMRDKVATIARGNMLYSEPAEGNGSERWTERSIPLGIHEGEWAWGCQFIDVDANGSQEILVTNGFATHQSRGLGDWQTYYWRQVIDDARRLEAGERSTNVNAKVRFRGSFNGHERDRLFVRTEGSDPARPWVDGGFCLGFDESHDGRALAPLDADGDGDLDLALWTLGGLRYYENTSAPAPWTRLRLLLGEDRSTPALGARVRVTSGGRTRAGHVAIVEGFQSQISTDVHFGLAGTDGSTVDRVEVTWADGTVETATGLSLNQLHVLRPGFSSGSAASPRYDTMDVPRWSHRHADLTVQDVDGRPWTEALALIARTPAAMGQGSAPLVVHVTSLDSQLPDPFHPFVEPSEEEKLAPNVRVVRAYLRTGDPREPNLSPLDTVLLEPELYAAAAGDAEETTVIYDVRGTPMRVVRGPASLKDIKAFTELGFDETPFPHLLIEHGRMALDEARYRDAVALFRGAVEGRTDLAARDAPAFEGLGRAHVLLDRIDLAEEAYRLSVSVDPDYAIGHLNLGATYSHLGKFDEAVASLSEARRIEGDTPRVLGALAEAAASGDRSAVAREAAEAWLAVEPEARGVRTLLGKIEARAGKLEEARQHFEIALQLDPGNQEARAALQRTLQLLSGQGATRGK